jgi:hypothetical protein
VESQILGLLSLDELGRVAPVCAFWHSTFAKEADRLRNAHTSFDVEAMIDRATVWVNWMDYPFLTAPLLQGLGRAWDTVCAYLSKPYHHSLSCWVNEEGHIVGGRVPDPLAREAYVSVNAHVMDGSGWFCRGKARTMWHISIFCRIKESTSPWRVALHFLCVCSRKGRVIGPPRTLLHDCRFESHSLHLYLCIVLMIGERLGGTLQMLAQRLVPRGVATMRTKLRGEALIQGHVWISGLGKLLLYRTFRENSDVIRLVLTDDAHRLKWTTCPVHRDMC